MTINTDHRSASTRAAWRRGVAACWLVVACALSVADARAQSGPAAGTVVDLPPAGVTQELELKDGSRLYGRLESETPDAIVFRTLSGTTLTVPRSEVAALRVARGRTLGERFLPADANATRLFFAPTGRALRQRESYLGVYEVFYPFVQAGVTDRFSVGGGTPLVFMGEGSHPVWVTPKVQVFANDRVQAAAGLMHLFNVGRESLGIAYGVVTAGSPDGAVTAGIGWGYHRRVGSASGSPIVMVGGESRIRHNMKFITENYAFRGGGILTGGVRFLGEHASIDLGAAAPLGMDVFVLFPLVDFVWRF